MSEEAGRDQRTMDVCLNEIARCQQVTPRPNFVVLLGDRYGWRPLPPHVPADEFEAIREATPAADRALLGTWYRRDENALPPEYVLLPRTTDEHDRDWPTVERVVRRILLAGISAGHVSVHDRSIYEDSATHQEIFAGALSSQLDRPHEHVVCAFREIDEMPADRSAADFRDLDPDGSPDADAVRRLSALKDALRRRLGSENVAVLRAQWGGDGPTHGHLSHLCDEVLQRLTATLETELARIEHEDPVEAEDRAHSEFGAERARHFVGRDRALREIDEYLAGSAPHPFFLHGPSGCGKTAVMAKAVERATATGRSVIARYLGATPESTNSRELLDGICDALAKSSGAEAPVEGLDYAKVTEEFRRRIAAVPADRPVTLFLDALDQIDGEDPGAECWWILVSLPPQVRIVVSVMDGGLAEGVVRRASEAPAHALPGLPLSDGEALLGSWLTETDRRLSDVQRRVILRAFEAERLPLWLRIAFEQARRWRSFDEAPTLPPNVPDLIRRLFAGLSEERNHGRLLVERSLALIAAGRHGLTEDELLDVLSGDDSDHTVLHDFRRRSPKSPEVDLLPVVVWSRLYFDLAPYLTLRSADGTRVLRYYHRQLEEVMRGDYLDGADGAARHAELARHFARQPLRSTIDGRESFNRRALSELPFQQRTAAMENPLIWDAVEDTLLARYDFVAAKIDAGLVQDLVADCSLTLLAHPAGRPRHSALRLFDGALRLASHVLARVPKQLPSQLHGRLLGSEDSAIQSLLECVRRETHTPWLRPLRPSLTSPGGPLLCTLEGHSGWVNSVAVTPDGRRAVSASGDNTLRVWELDNGGSLRTLEGHTGSVHSVVMMPDGRRAVSASWDNTLQVWDLESGASLRTLAGHTGGVTSVAVTPDGRHAVSASDDGTLRVWDLETGASLRTLEGHNSPVTSVTVTPDGRRAVSASWDKTLRVWDLDSGASLRSLDGHVGRVQSLAVTPDGRRAVSSSWDKTLRVWDLDSGASLRTLEGHESDVISVAVTPDGRRAISASHDQTLRVWDLETGASLRSLA